MMTPLSIMAILFADLGLVEIMGSRQRSCCLPLFQLGYEIQTLLLRLRVESEGDSSERAPSACEAIPSLSQAFFSCRPKNSSQSRCAARKGLPLQVSLQFAFSVAPFHAVKIAVELQVLVRRKLVIEGNF